MIGFSGPGVEDRGSWVEGPGSRVQGPGPWLQPVASPTGSAPDLSGSRQVLHGTGGPERNTATARQWVTSASAKSAARSGWHNAQFWRTPPEEAQGSRHVPFESSDFHRSRRVPAKLVA